MGKITVTGLLPSRLPRTENGITFASIVDAMSYAQRAEALAENLQVGAKTIRKAIREALDADPAISFGTAAPNGAADNDANADD